MHFKMFPKCLSFCTELNVLWVNSGLGLAVLYIYKTDPLGYTVLWGIHAQEHAHVYIQWLILQKQIILFIIGLTPV